MNTSKVHINNMYIKYTFVHFAILLIRQVFWGSSSSTDHFLFLETSGLVNHQHLMIFLDFHLHQFQHREELGNYFRHPLHTIVHHEVLLTWWWWLENSVNHYFIWKINSHLIQAIVVPRQSEHMLTSWAILLHLLVIELVGDFISLNSGICLKY